MGRRKIQIEGIEDERIRRVTFKKRRIGLLKKAIQLSKLTNAIIEMRVYQPEDQSLIEYYSNKESDFDDIHRTSKHVYEYSKFFNKHYNLVSNLEEKVTKHGHLNLLLEEHENSLGEDIEDQLEGINMLQLFSLAKRTVHVKSAHEIANERALAQDKEVNSTKCSTEEKVMLKR